jgi:hypothetical protein
MLPLLNQVSNRRSFFSKNKSKAETIKNQPPKAVANKHGVSVHGNAISVNVGKTPGLQVTTSNSHENSQGIFLPRKKLDL